MNKKGANAITAMICITVLVIAALAMGYDGVLFLTGIGIISGLGGYIVLDDMKTIAPRLFFK